MAEFDWKTGARIVGDLLSGTRVDDMDRDDVGLAVLHGLIEAREQEKSCPTCGKPKFDYRYWRATPAGRLLVSALGDDQ